MNSKSIWESARVIHSCSPSPPAAAGRSMAWGSGRWRDTTCRPARAIRSRSWPQVAQSRRDSRSTASRSGRRQATATAQIAQRLGKANQADVLKVAVMPVSGQWIAVDSDLEGKIERKLRDEKRKFDKPLRYDGDECAVFPDFWLPDMQQDFAFEVFGM